MNRTSTFPHILLGVVALAPGCGGGDKTVTASASASASASSGGTEPGGSSTTVTGGATGSTTVTDGGSGSGTTGGTTGLDGTGSSSTGAPNPGTSTGTSTGTTADSSTGDASSSTGGSSGTGGDCQGQGGSCAAPGALCCRGLECCAGVPVPEGQEFCSDNCPISDRNLKTDIAAIDVDDVLRRVVALPISSWRYRKDGADVRHLGPMAQDFRAAFGLWDTDRMIFPLDASGVSLAAIQALDARLRAAEAQNEDLRARLERLERRLDPR